MLKRFIKYVSQNMLGMLGMSFYILADTFFISKAVGADGITALNLVLPLYNLIFAIGAMIGVGSAIRYVVERGRNEKAAGGYFFHAIAWALIISSVFVLAGAFIPDKIIALLGGDETIVNTGKNYTRIFMMFAPFFMCNYICNAFVRNDGNPSIAMAATLFSSLFNVVFDYVLMFPLGLSMSGAALATALSPIIGVLICCIHFKSEKCSISFKPVGLSIKKLIYSCQVGVSAFVGEISSGVITVAFNMIILGLAGNVGVAAYGVVANISLVAVALFNGIAQGSQPLVSYHYGKEDHTGCQKLLRYALTTVCIFAPALFLLVFFFAPQIVRTYLSHAGDELIAYSIGAFRRYSVSYLLLGFNIVIGGFMTAIERPVPAICISVGRGLALQSAVLLLLAAIFGGDAVWYTPIFSEALCLVMSLLFLRSYRRQTDMQA